MTFEAHATVSFRGPHSRDKINIFLPSGAVNEYKAFSRSKSRANAAKNILCSQNFGRQPWTPAGSRSNRWVLDAQAIVLFFVILFGLFFAFFCYTFENAFFLLYLLLVTL